MTREHLLTFCDPLIFGNATIFKYTNRKRPEFSYQPARIYHSLTWDFSISVMIFIIFPVHV